MAKRENQMGGKSWRGEGERPGLIGQQWQRAVSVHLTSDSRDSVLGPEMLVGLLGLLMRQVAYLSIKGEATCFGHCI